MPQPGDFKTLDGKPLTHGMRVWDYDLRPCMVDLEGRIDYETNQNDGSVAMWFDTHYENGRRNTMSHDRVWVLHPFDRVPA